MGCLDFLVGVVLISIAGAVFGPIGLIVAVIMFAAYAVNAGRSN